jgi:hypothetical protein
MTKNWEETFQIWAEPPSDTEQEKCERAERMIRSAISDHKAFTDKLINIIPQGSYHNDTNVRQDSDVDICACLTSTVYNDYSLAQNSRYNFPPATYTLAHFKRDLSLALTSKFGSNGIRTGSKAFDVHETTSRINADVVPALELRVHQTSGGIIYGTYIQTADGSAIFNFPKQHYANGMNKNTNTGTAFKKVTRVIKRLRNEMAENNVTIASKTQSYLIECLVYNVPNHVFLNKSYKQTVIDVLNIALQMTDSSYDSASMLEVNEVKFLFHYNQPWTKENANKFLLEAIKFIMNN